MGLTRSGLGRLSFSQMDGSKRPKSFPDTGDVGDGGALSRGAPVPRQKAQFIIDLFLLNGFWLNSKERQTSLLEGGKKGIYAIPLICLF